MAKRQLKDKAIKLRKKGKTYSEIRHILEIQKSTLSGWLSNYPLTEEQVKRLEVNKRAKKLIAIEKTTLTKLAKRRKRLQRTYESESKKLLPLTKRDLYLCGLFLYLGEGVKGLRSGVSLNNTDPKVVKFYHYWLTEVVGIPREKIRVSLHLYDDMDIKASISYWSDVIEIPKGQFIKPYIKKSQRKDIKQKGFGHGTCGIYIYDQYLKEKIMLGLDAIIKEVTGINNLDLV